jgi:hypothetical protein
MKKQITICDVCSSQRDVCRPVSIDKKKFDFCELCVGKFKRCVSLSEGIEKIPVDGRKISLQAFLLSWNVVFPLSTSKSLDKLLDRPISPVVE